MALPPFLIFFARVEKRKQRRRFNFHGLGCYTGFTSFLDLAVIFITQLEWRCTQTKAVIFLDNFAQFQDSAVLYQDLPILYQDSVVLATSLRVVNNTHRKHRRMNKQEHRCVHFGRVWNRDRTPFELCCDMNYRQRIIADAFCTNGCKFSFNGFRSVLQDRAMVWEWRCNAVCVLWTVFKLAQNRFWAWVHEIQLYGKFLLKK